MHLTKGDYLSQWRKVEKNGETAYFKEFNLSKERSLVVKYYKQKMYYFTNDEKSLNLNEVKKYKETIQEKVLCELKSSGLAKFQEIAYKILRSEDFIELKRIIEK